MEFIDLARNRYSVREYSDKAVEKEKLDKILEAAYMAPTACNLQPFKIVVVRTSDHKEILGKVYPRPFFTQAPIILGVYADTKTCWVRRDGKSYSDVDAAIIMDHMIMEATDLGLGTCWVGAFDKAAACSLAGFDKSFEPVAFTPLGYASSQKPQQKRKPLEDIVVYL